jgi:hypothetical protein
LGVVGKGVAIYEHKSWNIVSEYALEEEARGIKFLKDCQGFLVGAGTAINEYCH